MTSTKLLNAGDRVESMCTRCNDLTGHIITAIAGGEVVKVECQACGSLHKHRPPAKVKAPTPKTLVTRVKAGDDRAKTLEATAKPASAPKPARQSAAATKARKNSVRAAEEREGIWQKTLAKSLLTPKKYSMTEAFEVDDVIDHSLFGLGMVIRTPEAGKMEVLFRDAQRLLRRG